MNIFTGAALGIAALGSLVGGGFIDLLAVGVATVAGMSISHNQRQKVR